MCKIGSPLLSFLSCSLCTLLQKYEKAQMEVIEFENEDVITTSGCQGTDVSVKPWECGNEGQPCWYGSVG